MQILRKHRQYQQNEFSCPICEGVGCLWGVLSDTPLSSFIIWVCVSHICDAHIAVYYVQILFLAHILANICSILIFELPSLPCALHIVSLWGLEYVLHITEDKFRITLPRRQMWHRSSVSLLSYSVKLLLSTTEPCLRDCQRTCHLGRDSSLPPQQSVCAQIYGASVNLPLRHTDNPLKVMVTVLVYGNPIAWVFQVRRGVYTSLMRGFYPI